MGNNNCTCCCAHGNAQPNKQPEHTGFLKDYGRILLSAALLFSGIILKATGMGFFADNTVMFAWYLAAYLPVGLPVLKEAWESILQKDIFSEFTLMSIATLGAFYIKEYPEGVAVMLFYSLGELFQERAVSKAKRNISALIDVNQDQKTNDQQNAINMENQGNELLAQGSYESAITFYRVAQASYKQLGLTELADGIDKKMEAAQAGIAAKEAQAAEAEKQKSE
mgnify:CR=1 FL=1